MDFTVFINNKMNTGSIVLIIFLVWLSLFLLFQGYLFYYYYDYLPPGAIRGIISGKQYLLKTKDNPMLDIIKKYKKI